ncbi:hypothetical protein M409DRAFT_23408 [Zasmidium cellare ATCC 36951]|uniref:Uncharacterized protein n=1 Tax=Zasmidium cellare ATCC 36951 TaxID=1080233 RepID=A0A6A6CLB6_ZASCE|nr:uncharacterized protein M409DRAFT_23408 [Zasmidium cellare ATCC 36951]KAF2166216.1 hypothetical protein M409DRAFT_23408 [Zasmidium cellare ATCC 36951]
MGIEHHFNGDSSLLNETAIERNDVRKALSVLHKSLQRIESVPTQITAEIRLNVSGPNPKEHIYTVAITDSQFDSDLFARTKTPAKVSKRTVAPASSPPASIYGQGDRRASLSRGVPEGDDDVTEVRPFKRARVETEEPVSDDPVQQKLHDILSFVKKWHDEWKHQGGWLFDNLSGANKIATERSRDTDKKLETLQDILGQSINSASATTMSELSNITKLLPWLEHCRKTHADKVQAREEKWRSSSATFHDQSRRDRESAEKRLEEKLEAQKRLLVKIAESNGIDVDEITDNRSRESSLGAQLTAELNMEATRADEGGSRANKGGGRSGQPINIDD